MTQQTSYDALLASGQYEENPPIDATPVKAFLYRWEHHGYLMEPAQYEMYRAIVKQVEGLIVCDAGSGPGLGTLVLAQRARLVVGVEIVAAGTKFSKRCYPVRNIEFVCADILQYRPAIEFGRFDAIVAIELIEHIFDYHGALMAISELLKEDGTLYISSPNRNRDNMGKSKPHNRHHVREWTIGEFGEVLSLYFSHVGFYDRILRTALNRDSKLSPVIAVCHKV